MHCLRLTLLVCLGLSASLSGLAQDKGEVKLDVVKYDGLKDSVLRNRGKVVLVDFWTTS
jgi:hypothetical protein